MAVNETSPKPYDGPIVAVAAYSRPLDAHMARGALEEAGIPAFVEGENSAQLHEVPVCARLMVRGEDLDRARAILEGGEPVVGAEGAPRAALTSAGRCPRCHASLLRRRLTIGIPEWAVVGIGAYEAIVLRRWPWVAGTLLLVLAAAIPRRRWSCPSCGGEWSTRRPDGPAADPQDVDA